MTTASLRARARHTPRVTLKADRAYWEPSRSLRRMGFKGQSLGRLTSEALNRADELNEAADHAVSAADAARPAPDTLAHLVERYQASKDYPALPATRKHYDRHLRRACADMGPMLAEQITKARVESWHAALGGGRDAYNHVATLRTALAWGVTEDLVRRNVASDVDLARPQSHKRIGTRDELWELVRAADEIGRPSIAVAAVLLVATMQRPGDVLRLTTDNVDAGVLWLTQSKTKAELSFIMHPVAMERLGHLGDNGAPLLVDERSGEAYSERQFQRAWADVRTHAAHAMPSLLGEDPEVRQSTLQGPLAAGHLRRSGMVWAAESGATIPEICSISGHSLDRGMQILETYLPRQRLLADRAVAKLNLHRAPSLEDMSQTLLSVA